MVSRPPWSKNLGRTLSTSQLVLTELRTSLALFSTPFLQELWHWDLLPTNNTILVNMSFAHSPSARIWQNLFPTVWAKGDSYDEGCWKLDLISRCSLISKFEMCALQLFLFWLLSRESGVSFTEAQSILTALCFEIAYLLLVHKHFNSSKQIRRELKIQMFPHQNYELLEIKCNFWQPSSSELSL